MKVQLNVKAEFNAEIFTESKVAHKLPLSEGDFDEMLLEVLSFMKSTNEVDTSILLVANEHLKGELFWVHRFLATKTMTGNIYITHHSYDPDGGEPSGYIEEEEVDLYFEGRRHSMVAYGFNLALGVFFNSGEAEVVQYESSKPDWAWHWTEADAIVAAGRDAVMNQVHRSLRQMDAGNFVAAWEAGYPWGGMNTNTERELIFHAVQKGWLTEETLSQLYEIKVKEIAIISAI